MTLEVTFRPIDVWPGELTAEREHSQFTVGYSDTLQLLERELDALDACMVVIQLALSDRDLRLDGLPRANAKPDHPGVILAFRVAPRTAQVPWRRVGAQEHWQHNLRAIALGLEALRKVDRYGITRRGEQYRGWNALGAGEAMPATHMTRDEAAAFIAEHAGPGSGFTPAGVRDSSDNRYVAYRLAAKRLHPDVQGGDEALFVQLQAARDLLARGALTGGAA